ncbi:MAG: hypothetical protein ACTH2E_04715 [Microbacterium sp.]
MTISSSSSKPRRGLAISSIVAGAVATLMIIGFWLIGGASDGQGLSNATVIAVLFFYASVVVGAIAVLLGVAAIIFSRPRLFGVLGIVLGLVPIVVVAVSTSIQAG